MKPSVPEIIAEPILEWFGFSQLPFPKHLKVDQIFQYSSYKQILMHLNQVLLTSEIGVVIGETGTGKTTLISSFKEEAIEKMYRVIEVKEPPTKKRELYKSISQAMGVNVTVQGADVFKVLDLLKFSFLESQRTNLLIIDEAHLLSKIYLNELRILTNSVIKNKPILALVLFGQPSLGVILKDPELIDLAQRILVWTTMNCLEEKDSLGYLDWHLKIANTSAEVFTNGAKALLVRRAKGNPRMISHLGWECLYRGYVDQAKTITEELVSFVFKNLGPHLS